MMQRAIQRKRDPIRYNAYARNVANVKAWCTSNLTQTVMTGLQRPRTCSDCEQETGAGMNRNIVGSCFALLFTFMAPAQPQVVIDLSLITLPLCPAQNFKWCESVSRNSGGYSNDRRNARITQTFFMAGRTSRVFHVALRPTSRPRPRTPAVCGT
jgi:hypothetical protein